MLPTINPSLPLRDRWLWTYHFLGWNPLLICSSSHQHMPPEHLRVCQNPGKVPIGKWKHLQTKPYTKADLFREIITFSETNVGILLGKSSGLIGIDLDSQEGIDWFKEKLKDESGGVICYSTSRGYRLLYQHHTTKPWPASGVLYPGVELLSEGRQTVMPPSTHASGHVYSWCDDYDFSRPLPPLPLFVYEMAASKPAAALPSVTEGQPFTEHRNPRLFKMACSLRRQGAGQFEIRQCLQILNRLCKPPLEDLVLDTITKSACKYQPSL